MKNTIWALALMGTLAACDSGSSASNEAESPLAGDWQFTYEGTVCVERYSFNSDMTFTESSLTESTSGVYTYDDSGTGRAKLDMVITNDNGLSDCNGVSSDDTNDTWTAYVEFLNEDAMRWFRSETGSTSIVLTKN